MYLEAIPELDKLRYPLVHLILDKCLFLLCQALFFVSDEIAEGGKSICRLLFWKFQLTMITTAQLQKVYL